MATTARARFICSRALGPFIRIHPADNVVIAREQLVGGTWRWQNGSTKTMIFSVAKIIAYVSRFKTLEPGDLIMTGTPPGVGMGAKPDPVYLKPGDRIRLGVER